MKRLVLLASVFSALLGFASYVAAQQALEQANEPVFGNGDSWIFSYHDVGAKTSRSTALPDGNYKLVYKDGEFLAFDMGGQEVTTPEIDLLKAMLRPSKDASQPYYVFPLRVGQKLQDRVRYQCAACPQPIWTSVDTTATGMEKVIVPAGSFSAFKLEQYVYVRSDTWKFVYYYSPEAKGIVKFRLEFRPDHIRTVELVEYRSAAQR